MIETREFYPCADRLRFDAQYQAADGWAQIDTQQDASYFGQWANPLTWEYASYCEGDFLHQKYETEEEFVAHIRHVQAWHLENETWGGIDGMCRLPIIQAFEALGLNDLLH